MNLHSSNNTNKNPNTHFRTNNRPSLYSRNELEKNRNVKRKKTSDNRKNDSVNTMTKTMRSNLNITMNQRNLINTNNKTRNDSRNNLPIRNNGNSHKNTSFTTNKN